MLPDEISELVRQYGEGDRLRDHVIGHGRVTEQQFAQALAEQHGLAFVDLGALVCPADDCARPADGFDPVGRPDGLHFSPAAARQAAAWLAQQIDVALSG